MGTVVLFLAFTACPLVRPPVEVTRSPIAIEQVPKAARATLERQAKGRPLYRVMQVAKSDGCVVYEARFQKPLRYSYDVAVASSGDLIGRWSTERSGDGP